MMHSDTHASALQLDEAALRQAATADLDEGAVTPAYGPHRDAIIALLNDALATELVCVLRYKRHYFTADGRESPAIAAEFLVHANEEAAHADLLAQRIVQLGGSPDFSPSTLLSRSHLSCSSVSPSRMLRCWRTVCQTSGATGCCARIRWRRHSLRDHMVAPS